MKNFNGLLTTILLTSMTAGAHAQSLYEVGQPQRDPLRGQTSATIAGPPDLPSAGVALHDISLFAITPPEPRAFKENDLVTVIVSERSRMRRSQSLDTEKEFAIDGQLTSFLDLSELIKGRFQVDNDGNLPEIGLDLNKEFQGEGEYDRRERLTDRITARVVEVKPNGTLLLEARRLIKTDDEESTATLSGICRQKDVTDRNTVQSNQIFDLALIVENEGELRKTTEPGLIQKAMDLLFNF